MPKELSEDQEAALSTIHEVIDEMGLEEYINAGPTEQKESKKMPKSKWSEEVETAFQRGVDRAGGIEEFARRLYDDNYTQREEIRDLKDKLPTDGSVLLSPEEGEAWEAIAAIGPIEAVISQLNKSVDTENELNKMKRQATLAEIAEHVAPGVKFKPSVLAKLDAEIPGLVYEVRTTKNEDGTESKSTVVKYKDGESTKEAPLSDFAKDKWGDFMPSLVDADATLAHGNGPVGFRNGTPYPATPAAPGGSQPQKSVGQSYAASRYGQNAPQPAKAK